MFLAEVIPAAVPDSASPTPPGHCQRFESDQLAEPLSVSLVEYGRRRTRFDHQAEICAAYGCRPFDTAGVERELWFW